MACKCWGTWARGWCSLARGEVAVCSGLAMYSLPSSLAAWCLYGEAYKIMSSVQLPLTQLPKHIFLSVSDRGSVWIEEEGSSLCKVTLAWFSKHKWSSHQVQLEWIDLSWSNPPQRLLCKWEVIIMIYIFLCAAWLSQSIFYRYHFRQLMFRCGSWEFSAEPHASRGIW